MYLPVRTVLSAIGLSTLRFADAPPARSSSLQYSNPHQAALTCGSTSIDQQAIGQMDAWTDQVVNGHNTFRAQYSAPAVGWNATLYPGTLQWAQQCVFSHRHVGC